MINQTGRDLKNEFLVVNPNGTIQTPTSSLATPVTPETTQQSPSGGRPIEGLFDSIFNEGSERHPSPINQQTTSPAPSVAINIEPIIPNYSQSVNQQQETEQQPKKTNEFFDKVKRVLSRIKNLFNCFDCCRGRGGLGDDTPHPPYHDAMGDPFLKNSQMLPLRTPNSPETPITRMLSRLGPNDGAGGAGEDLTEAHQGRSNSARRRRL